MWIECDACDGYGSSEGWGEDECPICGGFGEIEIDDYEDEDDE